MYLPGGKGMQRGRSFWAGYATVFLLFLGVVSVAHAQVLYGSLTGNVTDPSGAAVPGAKVEVLNVNTNSARQAETDVAGVYVFNNLQPGAYKVTVTSTGFQTIYVENIPVDGNQTRRVDLSLKVSTAETTIEVSAPA